MLEVNQSDIESALKGGVNKPSMSSDELAKLYTDAKDADKEAHAEMRSNILLVEGSHYSKRVDEYWNTRGIKQTSDSKLRITKNWIHRAHRIYVNSIINKAPGVQASPRNEYELQHKKSAELNQSVIEYLKQKYKMRKKHRDWCSDYVSIGEACVLVTFDPTKGKAKGYEPLIDETGLPVTDENGYELPDETKPVMSGEFVFKRIFGHQLFRDPNVASMEESSFIGIDDVVPIEDLKRRYKGDEDKLKSLSSTVETFIVFDSNKGSYAKNDSMVSIRHFYFKPSQKFKNGYFFLCTREKILEHGELPYGIWPIAWVGFDEHPTKVRATSMVKVAKPFNAEINRASSQTALHQITMASDKILTQAGTKIEQGTTLPGVRGLTYSGAPPTILPGRVGDQFYEYIDRNIAEMSQVLFLDQIDADKMNNLDPFAMLFRSMNQDKHFVIYGEKFGEFLIDVYEITLELAKKYLDNDEYIAAVGKSELINIEEFRNTSPLYHRICLEEQEDTIETKLGRHLTMTNLLQYVGSKLSDEEIGKMMENSPFGNWKDTFSRFTQPNRNVKNDFLAIERGQMPYISPKDDSDYVLSEIAARKKERDYALLDPQVQALYDQYEQYHEQKYAEEQEAIKAAQNEYIPTGGALVEVGVYMPPTDPTKVPKRARLPYEAVQWLMKQLETQGMNQDQLAAMNQAQQAEVFQMIMKQGQLPPQGALRSA